MSLCVFVRAYFSVCARVCIRVSICVLCMYAFVCNFIFDTVVYCVCTHVYNTVGVLSILWLPNFPYVCVACVFVLRGHQ